MKCFLNAAAEVERVLTCAIFLLTNNMLLAKVNSNKVDKVLRR